MITINANGRVGKPLNEKGFMTVAMNQYDKGAPDNTLTTWLNVWVPESLREKAATLEKGNAVILSGQLMFELHEYEGNKTARVTVLADSIQKYFGSNGEHFFIIRNGRLGKDPISTKNGGRMFNVASDHYRNGEQKTSWITCFVNPELADRVDSLLKKGSSIDAVGTKMVFEVNKEGYLNATLNISSFGYGASSPKKQDDSDNANNPLGEVAEPEQPTKQVESKEELEPSFEDFDSLEDFDYF